MPYVPHAQPLGGATGILPDRDYLIFLIVDLIDVSWKTENCAPRLVLLHEYSGFQGATTLAFPNPDKYLSRIITASPSLSSSIFPKPSQPPSSIEPFVPPVIFKRMDPSQNIMNQPFFKTSFRPPTFMASLLRSLYALASANVASTKAAVSSVHARAPAGAATRSGPCQNLTVEGRRY